MKRPLVPAEQIERLILLIRGRRVVLDADLARIYGVTTARLNQQVKRNRGRFPADFVFQLSTEEHRFLMLQSATSKSGRGGRRKLPYAFTEHGAIMLASVLNTPIAVHASVQVVRAFVRLRQMLVANRALAERLEAVERQLEGHDAGIRNLFQTIRQLLQPPAPGRPRIGFLVREGATRYKAARRKAR